MATLSVEYRRNFHAGHHGLGHASDLDEWTLRGSNWRPGQPRPSLVPVAAGEMHYGFLEADGSRSWVWLAPVRSPAGSTCSRCATSGGGLMSSHEAQARARKVAALVALVPAARGQWHARRLACRLARFTTEERARWAAAAGVREASPTTWAWVVAAVRGSV